MVFSPEAAKAVDLVFAEQLCLGPQYAGVRPSSLGEENGGGQQTVKIDADSILALEQGAEALQFRLTDPLPVVGAQVVEHEKKTCGQAGTDGGGEIGLLCGGIKVGPESAQNALSGKRCQTSGRSLLVELPSRIGGENDHGVAEIDIFIRKIIMQSAAVQNLQKQLNGVAVGFFHFIDQKQTAGMFIHKPGENARLCVLEAGGEADQVQVCLMVGIGAHVQLFVRQVQSRCSPLRHKSLSYSGRSRENKQRPGSLASLVGGGQNFRAEQALCQGVDSVVLTVDSAQELIPHGPDAGGQNGQKCNPLGFRRRLLLLLSGLLPSGLLCLQRSGGRRAVQQSLDHGRRVAQNSGQHVGSCYEISIFVMLGVPGGTSQHQTDLLLRIA